MGSDWGIVAQAQQLAARTGSPLATIAASGPITVSQVRDAARDGDEDCRGLLARRAEYLGQGISRVVNFTDVQGVIVSMHLPEPDADPERQVLIDAYYSGMDTGTGLPPRLLVSQLRDDYLLTGAAALVIRQICSPSLNLSRNSCGTFTAGLD
jgi:predicted NBD/HSP70 family sugar kinase